MTAVLLSIKPEFAEKIFSGEKKFEFRRSMFKKNNITRVIVYVTRPIKMVVGEFEIEEIIQDDIDSLWGKTCMVSGITKEHFYNYFKNKEVGFAIKIKSYKKYNKPMCIKEHYGVLPPQSFAYINLGRKKKK